MVSNTEIALSGYRTGSPSADITNLNLLASLNPGEVSGAFESGVDSFRDFMGDITGRNQAEAAMQAALSQTELGRAGLQAENEALLRLEQTLAPFLQAGAGLVPQAQRLFGTEAVSQISQDPAFQQAADRSVQQLLASQAARGRVATGETPMAIQSTVANLGSDFLSRQRGDLLSALGLGQASAAQQAAGQMASGQRGSDLLTQIGNSQAAGSVAAQNALSRGQETSSGLIGGILSMFSDRKLKRNISKHGEWRGYNTYKYQYKNSDDWFIGVMSDEVKAKNPDAVSQIGGFDVVDYGAL